MDIRKFRRKLKLDSKIIIDGKIFSVKEIVKFRLDSGSFYLKLFLGDDYVLADDLSENIYIFVKDVTHQTKSISVDSPPKNLKYDGKDFDFLYTEHAVAEEVWGAGSFRKGESESFWNYQAKDGSYLSLGIVDKDGSRLDFAGRILKPEELILD